GNDGVLWVTGAGDSRFFAHGSNGAFTSPAGDFGTLVENGDGSFTYSSRQKTVWQFDDAGYLLSITDRDEVSRLYQYDQGLLTTVIAPDGAETTFHYSGNLLTGIGEPGGRTVFLGTDGEDLTQIIVEWSGPGDSGSDVRTLTYTEHHLTED